MAIIKCKMCGGDLVLVEGQTVAECEYCGSRQTVPTADNEKKMVLFARANRLRAGCEFDKAAGVYESIVADFPEEAEAYWGLVLCRYGIEYVDDPATGKKIPTCHRSSFDSILEDSDFDQACENADAVARKVYREEAKQIEELRKGIIEVSGKEQPYDIFICYKETDDNGERTLDSVLAQDIYDALIDKGYRVFFSRITLEDKLGTEYEPYIFAALNSAKIMLAVGTDYEYYNAVWVKNEWSRFLKLMASDKSKHLIPCYKGIDAYDMPREFAKLQAQDLGKVGALQDLLRGVEKIIQKKGKPAAEEKTATIQTSSNTASLLRRASLFLEDGEWEKADEYCEKVLDIDPENATAYLYKLMAQYEVHRREELKDCEKLFDNSEYFKKVLRFGDPAIVEEVQGYSAIVAERIAEKERKAEEERKAVKRNWKSAEMAGHLIGAGEQYTVGLKSDGTVVTVGRNEHGQCNVSRWTDIVAISVGNYHTVGLKTNGTVVAVGQNENGQCNVRDWTDIVAVSAATYKTVGLKADGTVVTAGHVWVAPSNWKGIVAISAGERHTIGLKSDGTVVVVKDDGADWYDVSDWTDIVAISAGGYHTVGLKTNGTVVAVGSNQFGQCNVSDWTDIVAVSAATFQTVGLKADGTVVTTESERFDTSHWTDIVAVSAGYNHTIGLKSDGTVVVTVENNHFGQCNVGDWKLFRNWDTLVRNLTTQELKQEERRKRAEEERRAAEQRAEEERRAAERRAEEERRAAKQRATAEKEALQTELANLRGLFTGKRRREIENRLAQIEEYLEGLN